MTRTVAGPPRKPSEAGCVGRGGAAERVTLRACTERNDAKHVTTMGSLFDGIGGFPLAAMHQGITPLWASEIESFPIQVTKYHFPEMLHVGDITRLDGAELPPVDIICGGSPCQDLSVASCTRAGLTGAGSGLFLEQIRVTKEMRNADVQRGRTGKSVRPRWFCWENVPYALQRINDVMNRNQLCVVPPKSSETEQKSPVSLHIIFGFSQARTATQSTPYPVPNEMPSEDQDGLLLSPKQPA